MIGFIRSFTTPFLYKTERRCNGFAALRSSNYRERNHFSFHTNTGPLNLKFNQNRCNTAS